MKKIFLLFIASMFMAAVSVKAETISCAECGMVSDAGSPFTSRIVQNDKTLYFCDIGDLLVYFDKKKLRNPVVEVKDYPSGAWIDAQQAHYVRAAGKFKSPMGWGIAAFKAKEAAAGNGIPMDFQGALKAVR